MNKSGNYAGNFLGFGLKLNQMITPDSEDSVPLMQDSSPDDVSLAGGSSLKIRMQQSSASKEE